MNLNPVAPKRLTHTCVSKGRRIGKMLRVATVWKKECFFVGFLFVLFFDGVIFFFFFVLHEKNDLKNACNLH